ncbi:FBX21 protein, partial [Atractosteus spatula]|nr:FBX21 protein [Atractosteus spatula]
MATSAAGDGHSGLNGTVSEASGKKLTDLPAELLEYILCFPVLNNRDIANVSCACKRLHDVCHGRGKVWEHQYKIRWPGLLKHYPQTESHDWLKEYRKRYVVGLQIRRTVESFSKRFFAEVVLGDSFTEIESLGAPEHFCEDELISILNSDRRKNLTLKYYAKKILYFLRQQNILKSLKSFLARPPEQQSTIEGAVLVDQYCNPLADVSLQSISTQLDEIVDKIKKTLQIKNPSHPSLRATEDDGSLIDDFEQQRQVVCALNSVLYDQLQYKGNECDYYNPLNSYLHQVLIRRTGIPISLSVLYLTLARKLGVKLEPVNFPNHFLLRWCQQHQGKPDIYDYVYIDTFGKGKQLTAKECEYLIGHQVTSDYYCAVSTTEVLLRMVGNLLNIGKRGSGYSCVIYGWDPKCMMSMEWITTMRVHQLAKGPNQPFYNVLVQDGTCRYAAQENLEFHPSPLEIGHPEIGRYFAEFSDTHYTANEELQTRYPEDAAETLRTLQEQYNKLNTNSGHEEATDPQLCSSLKV